MEDDFTEIAGNISTVGKSSSPPCPTSTERNRLECTREGFMGQLVQYAYRGSNWEDHGMDHEIESPFVQIVT
jgi:hypothetical protein